MAGRVLRFLVVLFLTPYATQRGVYKFEPCLCVCRYVLSVVVPKQNKRNIGEADADCGLMMMTMMAGSLPCHCPGYTQLHAAQTFCAKICAKTVGGAKVCIRHTVSQIIVPTPTNHNKRFVQTFVPMSDLCKPFVRDNVLHAACAN